MYFSNANDPYSKKVMSRYSALHFTFLKPSTFYRTFNFLPYHSLEKKFGEFLWWPSVSGVPCHPDRAGSVLLLVPGKGERTRVTGHVCPCVPAAIWAARSEHRQTTSAFTADGSGRRQAHEKGTYSGCPVAHGAEEWTLEWIFTSHLQPLSLHFFPGVFSLLCILYFYVFKRIFNI